MASANAKTIWRLTGEEVASCNCAWGCPCQFNGRPTHDQCEALVALQVAKGHFGAVSLDSVRFAAVAWFPGAMHEGNGTLQFVFDENTTPEQREALGQIWSGKFGGTICEIFAAVCPNRPDPIVAPVKIEVDRDKRIAHILIPGLAESAIEPIRNPVNGEEHRARIQLPFGFEYREAEVANSVRWKATGQKPLRMEHANTYAQLNAFDWSNL